MGKLGYISVLSGILIIIIYGMYTMLSDFSIPLPIKIAFFLITLGIFIIIINLIIIRREERKEEDDSSKY